MVKIFLTIIIIYLKIIQIYSGDDEKSGKNVDENRRKEKSPVDPINSGQQNGAQIPQYLKYRRYLASQQENLGPKISNKVADGSKSNSVKKKRQRSAIGKESESSGLTWHILESSGHTPQVHLNIEQTNKSDKTLVANNKDIGINTGKYTNQIKTASKNQQEFERLEKHRKIEEEFKKLIQMDPQIHKQQFISGNIQQKHSSTHIQPADELAQLMFESNNSNQLILPQRHEEHSPSSSFQQHLSTKQQNSQIFDWKRKGFSDTEADNSSVNELIPTYQSQSHQTNFESFPSNTIDQNAIRNDEQLMALIQQHQQMKQKQNIGEFGQIDENANWQQLQHLIGGGIEHQHVPTTYAEHEHSQVTANFESPNIQQHSQFAILPPNSINQNAIEEQQSSLTFLHQQQQIEQQIHQRQQQHQNIGFGQIEEGANWQRQKQHLIRGNIDHQIHLPNQHFIVDKENSMHNFKSPPNAEQSKQRQPPQKQIISNSSNIDEFSDDEKIGYDSTGMRIRNSRLLKELKEIRKTIEILKKEAKTKENIEEIKKLEKRKMEIEKRREYYKNKLKD